jgi:hypothetical protein
MFNPITPTPNMLVAWVLYPKYWYQIPEGSNPYYHCPENPKSNAVSRLLEGIYGEMWVRI